MVFKLFITFFKIGLFTFGGGYAMIPLIETEVVEKKSWINGDEFLEILSVTQMTPGPIAINFATFVGNKMSGILGSIIASFGVILPSFSIITFIVLFLEPYFNTETVSSAFMGIKSCVIALILFSVVKIFKKSVKTKISFSIFTISFLALFFSLLSPIKVILMGVFFGMTFYIFFPLKNSDGFEKGDKNDIP